MLGRLGLLRAPLRSAAVAPKGQRRGMAGLVKKNFYVEEWNGKREITEKTFKYDGTTVPYLIVLAGLFPAFIYTMMKKENAKKYEKLGTPYEQM